MLKSKYKIVLGSSSPRRKKIMEGLGLDFEIITADINEEAIRTNDYKQLPLLIARGKMEAVKKKVSAPAIIICADTVCVCDGELREKPQSDAQMREWLESYAKYPLTVHTGMVSLNTETREMKEAIETGIIEFKPLPEKLIQALLKRDDFKGGSGAIIFDSPELHHYLKKVIGDRNVMMGLYDKFVVKSIEELSGGK